MMELKTLFGIGDDIYKVTKFQKTEVVQCGGCSGKGKLSLDDGSTHSCPRCYGRLTETEYGPFEYHATGPLKIGQVRAQEGGGDDKVQYMCHQTGIGSGTLHNEIDCFATMAQATEEAHQRNISEE
jgi:hypothetical protein